MQIFTDFEGRQIRLTDERLDHIRSRHPEMVGMESTIPETLAEPHVVVPSRWRENTRLYGRWYISTVYGDKWVLVVVSISDDSFVLTAYITNRITEP